MKHIMALRDMLGTLFGVSESIGSQPEELFQRFEDYNLADKRTRNAHRDEARKAREASKAEEEMHPYVGFAQIIKNSKV